MDALMTDRFLIGLSGLMNFNQYFGLGRQSWDVLIDGMKPLESGIEIVAAARQEVENLGLLSA